MYFPSSLCVSFILPKANEQDINKTIQAVKTGCHTPFELLELAKLVAYNGPLAAEIAKKLPEHMPPADLSPDDIRSSLIKFGIIPSPEEARDIYWSLGDDWWKQIIDGRDHRFGKMVYDKGLHGDIKEPGYLYGIEAASDYFTSLFKFSFDMEIYIGIHTIACAHFRGAANNTVCTFEKVKEFRTSITACPAWDMGSKALAVKKAEKINTEIAKIMKRYELEEPFAKCRVVDKSKIQMIYLPYLYSSETENFTRKIIARFNSDLLQLQKDTHKELVQISYQTAIDSVYDRVQIKERYRNRAIELIAKQFQEHEWHHLWHDGQGRTSSL